MEDILKEINAVLGVQGSFVCLDDGSVPAYAVPAPYTQEQIQLAARLASQMLQALEMANQRVTEIDWVYGNGRVIIRNLRGANLMILCARNVNLPLVNLTANVAAKKIATAIKTLSTPKPATPIASPVVIPEPTVPPVAAPEPTLPTVTVTEPPHAAVPAPNAIHAQLEQEAQRLLQEARRAGIALCVMDPLAIWVECAQRPQWLTPTQKRHLELAARSEQMDALMRAFTRLAYETNPRFNEFFSKRRLNFFNSSLAINIDVFMDNFEMYHRFDLTPFIRPDATYLPFVPLLLTRLQIVELNDNVLKEICALLFEHNISLVPFPNAIDASPITQLCAEDWGWHKTVMQNLAAVQDFAEETFPLHEHEPIITRAKLLQSGIQATPKSLRWQARARLGETIRWYETPVYPKTGQRS